MRLAHVRLVVAVVLCGGFQVAAARGAEETEPLEKGLLRQARAVLKQAGDKGYKNVGVLKFLAARSGQEPSDNLGTINTLLAQRLELALLLEDDAKQPVGIIRNASVVAAKTKGASHLTADGRRKLFEPSYPLSWGKQDVKADAFVTGVAVLSKDLKTMRCTFSIVDRKSNKLEEIGTAVLAVRPELLGEVGESYASKSAFKDAGHALAAAVKAREGKAVRVEAADNPVNLKVYYDNKPVDIDYRDGQAFVPEPQEGQKVKFVLERDDSKERYGVVLKVNGESSIRKQTLPDLSCLKWVLDPGDKPFPVPGYQMDDDSLVSFKAVSAERSRDEEVRYSADVGTITMTVFRDRKGEATDDDASEEAKKAKVLERAELPKAAENFEAMKSALMQKAKKKGLILDGDKSSSEIQRVSFTSDPIPVMCLTVVYYRAKGSR
jgi:hypothetical protein